MSEPAAVAGQKSPGMVGCLSAERLSGTEQFGEKHQEVGGGLWSRLKGKSASQSSICTVQTSTNTHVTLDFTDTAHLIRGKNPNCFGSSPVLHTFSMISNTIFNFGINILLHKSDWRQILNDVPDRKR